MNLTHKIDLISPPGTSCFAVRRKRIVYKNLEVDNPDIKNRWSVECTINKLEFANFLIDF